MDIKHFESGNTGSFYIEKEGKKLAEMTYSKAGNDKIIIDHTEVDESLRGTGAGKRLVEESVKYARNNNLKIIPLCPFARSVFQKNRDLSDVL